MKEEKDIDTIRDVSNQELDDIVPQMNINVPEVNQESNLVSDESLLKVYSEIMENIRSDRNEINEVLTNFVEMVINGGDASTSSKEALVNLLKMKNDTADKLTKVADLMTRVKLKEKDTFPKYLTAKQNNTYHITDSTNRRKLLEQVNHEENQ